MRWTRTNLAAAIVTLAAISATAQAGDKNFKINNNMRSTGNHGPSGGGGGNAVMRSQTMQFSGNQFQKSMLSKGGNGHSLQNIQRLDGAVKQYQIQPRPQWNGNVTGNSSVSKSIGRAVLSQNLGGNQPINRYIPGLTNKIKTKPIIDPGFGNGPVIDPGIGNGKPGKGDHDDHDHGDHHHGDHHHGHHHGHHHNQSWPWPWVITQPFPYPTYRYPSYPVTIPVVVERPVIVPVQGGIQGGPKLVDGVDLQLVDVRLVDAGDASRNLGPRYRVVIGNRGRRSAGNFQVLAVAGMDQEMSPDSPSMMTEVESVPSGQVTKVDLRLPLTAMTMDGGKPFRMLAVVVDVSKLIDEFSEEDNTGLMEREKISTVDAR